MSNHKFALVSTVDSLGDDFPAFCVHVFRTHAAAVKFAVKQIAKHDPATRVNVSKKQWVIDGESFDNAADFLTAWQDSLRCTEYFHILPISQEK